MPAIRTVVHEPADKAMTLDELAAFVHDAMRAGADGSELVKVRINFGGTIRRVEAEVRPGVPADAPGECRVTRKDPTVRPGPSS